MGTHTQYFYNPCIKQGRNRYPINATFPEKNNMNISNIIFILVVIILIIMLIMLMISTRTVETVRATAPTKNQQK